MEIIQGRFYDIWLHRGIFSLMAQKYKKTPKMKSKF